MRIIDLALKDLSQMFRDRRSLLFVVAMPIVFTIFMGFAYRGASTPAPASDNRSTLVMVNPQPDSQLSQALMTGLQSSSQFKVVPMNEGDAMAALNKGNAAGVLIVPADFNDQAKSGNTPQLKLVAQPASASGQALYQWLRGAISELMSAVETARISTVTLSDASEYSAAFDIAWSKWKANASQSLVQIEQATDQQPSTSDWTGGNPYNQSSPGILVMFAIFGLVTSAQIIMQERQTRTLQRLMTTAMRPWEIIAGHMLAMFSLTFLQTALLMVFGQFVLNVNYFREPLGSVLVAVTLGLWVAAVGLLIGVVAKNDSQVVLFSLIAMFLFSALGGTWFPLETAGGAFAAIGHLMPSAWAMDGFQNLLIRGQGLGSTLAPALVLTGYAILFFGLALWRFRKMEL